MKVKRNNDTNLKIILTCWNPNMHTNLTSHSEQVHGTRPLRNHSHPETRTGDGTTKFDMSLMVPVVELQIPLGATALLGDAPALHVTTWHSHGMASQGMDWNDTA